MNEIQGHKSDEISALDQIKYEYPPFIIEIAEDPISRERKTIPIHNILCCRVESDSFASQRDHRIYLRHPPRRLITRHERDQQQHQRHSDERHWINRAHAIKQVRD